MIEEPQLLDFYLKFARAFDLLIDVWVLRDFLQI